MDQLIAKLSSLSYEILGIILPGIIFLVLLAFWAVGTGDLLPYFSDNFFPRINLRDASKNLENMGARTGIGMTAPTALAAYFSGHLLHWISRSGKADDALVSSAWKRTMLSLSLKIPRPKDSYDKNLQSIFENIKNKLDLPDMNWSQFYPIAKNHLQRNNTASLVSIYQNKYTLHRSITTAAATVFWLCIATMLIGVYAKFHLCIEPRWAPMTTLLIGCLIIVWGFSSSYAYHWKLFGNSIITETYSILKFPSKNESKQ